MLQIYTDGAARGNPGPGGYGVVILDNTKRQELSQGYRLTTNNRMELTAAIAALQALDQPGQTIHLYSDSRYVVDAVAKNWLPRWIRTGFAGKKNADLWLEFHRLASKHQVHMHWVKAHQGHPENERCDQLAVASSMAPSRIDTVYEASRASYG